MREPSHKRGVVVGPPPTRPRSGRPTVTRTPSGAAYRSRAFRETVAEGELARLETGPGESSEHLFRRLLAAYLSGATGFEVSERPRISPPTRDVAVTFARRTRQTEVVAEDGSRIRLVETSVPDGAPVRGRLRELGGLVTTFHRRAVESWGQLPLRDDDGWEAFDDRIDRDAWYLERLAVTRPGETTTVGEAVAVWATAHALEQIGDQAIFLAQAGPRLMELGHRSPLVVSLRQLHAQALWLVEEALKEADGARANDLLDVGAALATSARSVGEGVPPAVGGRATSPSAAVAIERAIGAIITTVTAAQEIAQASLDRSLRTGVPDRAGVSPRTKVVLAR